MNNTLKTALGAMCIALSTAVMLASSLLPYFTYALPGMAALMVLFMSAECDRKWGFAVYAGTAIISALIVPGKEAVGIYIAVLGYYPLLKPFFDKPKKWISIIIKILFFIVVIIATYCVMMFVFGISTELLEESERYFLPVVLVLGTVAFMMYDKALLMLEIAYYRKWQRTVRKIFKKR
ncbi:MAG: hypothetical protein J6L62_04800 [Clostridia bacterium]|nr:hypothetical protein [Clostridia bacterium]